VYYLLLEVNIVVVCKKSRLVLMGISKDPLSIWKVKEFLNF
jgi:hypothetical protein